MSTETTNDWKRRAIDRIKSKWPKAVIEPNWESGEVATVIVDIVVDLLKEMDELSKQVIKQSSDTPPGFEEV